MSTTEDQQADEQPVPHPYLLDGYDVESINVFDMNEEHDIPFRAGDTVRVSPEHGVYADEDGVVQAIGMASGGVFNGVVADVLIAGTSDAERFYVDELEPLE